MGLPIQHGRGNISFPHKFLKRIITYRWQWILLIIIYFCPLSCKEQTDITAVNKTTLTAYPKNFEIFDNNDVCFIKYRNKINGFDVKVAVRPFSYSKGSIRGNAEIAFMVKDDCYMYFRTNHFRIDSLNLTHIANGDIIELDYKYPNIDKSKPIKFEAFGSLPFFFLDVDFDGKDELILKHANMGQRQYNAYEAVGLVYDFGTASYDYLYDSMRGVAPFSSFDDLSEIDYNKKEISTFGYGGNSLSEMLIYKIKDGQPFLHRIEDYDDMGFVLARRQILKTDTLTTYHNNRQYLYK